MNAKNSEEIIDLTEVVKVGEGLGVSSNSAYSENDVLDSLVNELEDTKDIAPLVEDEDDNVLDLTNLDNLISSYNIDTEHRSQKDQKESEQIDMAQEPAEDFDSIINDIKLDIENDNSEEANNDELIDLGAPLIEAEPITKENVVSSQEIEKNVIKTPENQNKSQQSEKTPLDVLEEDDPFDIDKHFSQDKETEKESSGFNTTFTQAVEEEKGLPFDLDVPLSSLDDEKTNDISLKDDDFNLDLDAIKESIDMPLGDENEDLMSDDIEALTNDIINGPQEKENKNVVDEPVLDFEDELVAMENENKKQVVMDNKEQDVVQHKMPKEKIDDVLAEISLEDDGIEQDFVSELKEDLDEAPVMDSFENINDKNENDDLIQSVTQVIESDKLKDTNVSHDNTLENKVLELSTNIASLQQRFVNSDSKWQVSNLEITNRISLIESRFTEFEMIMQKEFANLKELITQQNQQADLSNELVEKIATVEAKCSQVENDLSAAQNNLAQEISQKFDEMENNISQIKPDQNVLEQIEILENKLVQVEQQALSQNQINIPDEFIQRIEQVEDKLVQLKSISDRLANFDDIFAEQKMLSDELAKKMDTQLENGSNTTILENKIQELEAQLQVSNDKIASLELNLEKAVSMAAAKVLREEIIPLLTK